MRLRYLRIQGHPPLQDIAIPFGQENVLKRKLAIRFVVGVNGTGKTRLLQALTEVFISLARRRRPLPFPVTLAYDLGLDQPRTIFLHYPGEKHSNTKLIEFESILPTDVDWSSLEEQSWQVETNDPYKVRSRFLEGELPGIGSIAPFLPDPLLVYTSGYTDSWEALFAQPDGESIFDPLLLEIEDEAQERPASWTLAQEQEYQQRLGNDIPVGLTTHSIEPVQQILLTGQQIKLTACAVAFAQALKAWTNAPIDERLEKLLAEVGWKEPVTLSLRTSLPKNIHPQDAAKLHDLFLLAVSVVRAPDPDASRHVTLDLRRPVPDRVEYLTPQNNHPHLTIEAIFQILGGENASPYEVFRTLNRWQQNGILQDIEMTFRHLVVDNLMRYDWLSDGERMFLGRIAIFFLLQKQEDALLILDEPETHFNDYWKRQVVDIIDDALSGNASDVVIATHSSIALTDVFDTEITLLKKEDGTTVLVETPLPTFGTLPSEIMQRIFDAPNSIGQRAKEYLDLLLLLAQYPDSIQSLWDTNSQTVQERVSNTPQDILTKENATSLLESPQAFEDLLVHLDGQQEILLREGREPGYLVKVLFALRLYAQQIAGKQYIRVSEALDILSQRIGPGYYQFELRRRVRALKSRNNAT